MHKDHATFIQALHATRTLRVCFIAKKDNIQRTRTCAPLDFGPDRRAKDQSNRYHFWDYDSDDGPHSLSVLPEQIVSMVIAGHIFNPVDIVTWVPDWTISRDWTGLPTVAATNTNERKGRTGRRILIFNRITPEGLFATPDGNIDWAVPEDAVDQGAVEAMANTDTMLFGRKTYELFASFWPRVADEPSPPDPHQSGRHPPQMRKMAVWINETAKLVVSSTLTAPGWRNVRVLPGFDPHALAALKQQPGKDIIVFGSGSIVSQLAEHGLVDEYQLLVNPLLLGTGNPLFRGLSRRVPLALLEARPYPSGNVMLRYAPKRAP
ncbi:MAG TPA: dihydrofolate reductase family protein [Kofleriaceae bacterium]|nr:dihydrofolate reductase family protein [Kofleriaceae bacterium]